MTRTALPLAAAMLFCLPGALAADKPAGEPTAPAVPPAEFLDAVRMADAVAVGTVRSDTVAPSKTEAGAWIDAVRLAECRAIFGKPPVEATVYVTTQLPVGQGPPAARFQAGQKVLLAAALTEGRISDRFPPQLVAWSEPFERAARHALAPGWLFTADALRCPWCRGRNPAGEPGRCSACGKQLAQAGLTLCPACAAAQGACQFCGTKIGPASSGVHLRLDFHDPRNRQQRLGRDATIRAGDEVWAWISADLYPGATAAELPCEGGDLATCRSLILLVATPAGAEPAPIVLHRKPTPVEGARPLTNPGKTDLAFTTRGRIDPLPGFPMKAGTYWFWVAAGRLVSEPATLVVEGAPPAPLVQRPVAGGPTALWTPGDKVIQAARDGKLIWKMMLSFPVGNVIDLGNGTWLVQSADGTTDATVDAPTGKMLSMQKRQP